jgi:hypothetical protein
MFTAPAFLSWALAVAPVPPSDTAAPVAYAAPVVEADEYTSPAGHRTRWASAKYVLPDGKIAEVFIIGDDNVSAEATISVDGEAIVSANFDPKTGLTRWTSSEPGTSERAASAMKAIAEFDGGELLDAFIPDGELSGPCSESTKKLVRLAKYAWVGVIAVAEGVCCLGTSPATGGSSCLACIGLGGIAAAAGSDVAEDYCD